jgi:hypothetical protein
MKYTFLLEGWVNEMMRYAGVFMMLGWSMGHMIRYDMESQIWTGTGFLAGATVALLAIVVIEESLYDRVPRKRKAKR